MAQRTALHTVPLTNPACQLTAGLWLLVGLGAVAGFAVDGGWGAAAGGLLVLLVSCAAVALTLARRFAEAPPAGAADSVPGPAGGARPSP